MGITPENQEVFKFIEAVLGHDAMSKYGILVVTHTEKTTQQLRNEFKSLPADNLARRYSDAVHGRVVGLAKYGFPRELYATLEDLYAKNRGTALDCNMMEFSRITEQREKEFEQATRDLREKADLADALGKDNEALEMRVQQVEKELQEARQQRVGEIHHVAHYHGGMGGGGAGFGEGIVTGIIATAAAASGACCIQ